jgi:hypothetical protein
MFFCVFFFFFVFLCTPNVLEHDLSERHVVEGRDGGAGSWSVFCLFLFF